MNRGDHAAAAVKVMTMGTQATPPSQHDDDMPAEIDFSKGTRGKFYRQGARLHLPVYLDDQVQDTLARLAQAKASSCLPSSTTCCARTSNSSRSGAEVAPPGQMDQGPQLRPLAFSSYPIRVASQDLTPACDERGE